MKRLLLLLVFSASLFASAQTVNVDELTATGSNTLTHVYIGDAGDDAGYTRTSITSVTLIPTGMRLGNTEYALAGITELSELIDTSLGSDYASNLAAYSGGFWYQNNRGVFERVDSPVFDPLQAFSSSIDWRDEDRDGSYTRQVCDNVFIATLRVNNERRQYQLVRLVGGTFSSLELYDTPQLLFDAVNVIATPLIEGQCGAPGEFMDTTWISTLQNTWIVFACSNSFTIHWSNLNHNFVVRGGSESAVFNTVDEVNTYISDQVANSSAFCELLIEGRGSWVVTGDTLTHTTCGYDFVATGISNGDLVTVTYALTGTTTTSILEGVDGDEFDGADQIFEAISDLCNAPN